MSYVIERFSSVGSTQSAASGSSTAVDFALTSATVANGQRTAVCIAAIGADAYVKVVARTASAPTVSSTDYQFHIVQGTTLTLNCSRSVTPYITCAGGWQAVEVSG